MLAFQQKNTAEELPQGKSLEQTDRITGMLDTTLLSLMLYLLLCTVTVVTGHGLLRLLRLEVTGASALLLAPVLTLVFWSVALGIAGGWRLPIKAVSPWLWGVTILLAINGLCQRWSAIRAAGPMLLLCAVLPMVVMAPYFWHGLSDYIGSIAPDGWSYVAYGQYLWEYPRGTRGGLAPLYQYAAHLSGTRYIAPAMLGFFSPLVRAGDTQAVSSLFQAWTLFSMACAVALFWLAQKQTAWMVMTATVLSTGAGWIANVIWANNFDNELALVYMPALAGVARLCEARYWRWWLMLGSLVAGVVYSYPELALVSIAGAVLLALPRCWQERRSWLLWLRGSGIACVVAALLLLPTAKAQVAFVCQQFKSASARDARPGEGLFGGLVVPQFHPAAFWGLGGEHQLKRHLRKRNVLGMSLSILAVVGLVALMRKRQWELAALVVLLTLAAIYFILWLQYSYGAYKFIVVNWWCLVAALVAGAKWLLTQARKPMLRRGIAVGLVLLALLLLSQSRHTDAATTSQYINSPNQRLTMSQFRQVSAVKDIVNGNPLMILGDDWLANEWAVYYLRDVLTYLVTYHMYMGQAHVVPLMRQSATIDLKTIRYVLTDVHSHPRNEYTHGWQKKWSSDPYVLWQILSDGWVVLDQIENRNGIERLDGEPFFWIGDGDTTVKVLASKEGIVHLRGMLLLGPSVPEKATRTLMVTTDAGYQVELSLAGGAGDIPVPVHTGSNQIVLRSLDHPTRTRQPNGDTRPLVLGVRGLNISFKEHNREQ